jgi:hypothetical protein
MDYPALMDPRTMGILSAAFAGLGASGPSRMPVSLGQVIGQAGQAGLGTFQQTMMQNQQAQLRNLQGQAIQSQLEQQKRAQEAIDALAQQLPPDKRQAFLADPSGFLKAQNEGFTLSPGQQRIQGGRVVAQSAPNAHFADTGSGIVPLNPQTGLPIGSGVNKSMSPGEMARLAQEERHWSNLSAYQGQNLANDRARLGIDFGRLGLERQRTNFETMPGANGLTGAGMASIVQAGARIPVVAAAQAQVDLPNTIATAETASDLIDQMIGTKGLMLGKDQKEKAPHPGFSDLVGATYKPGFRFIPGTHAADFQALLDQVKGGAFLQAFNSLKGGGQITEVEGKKATDAITRMSMSQSEGEFIKAAREYQDVIRKGVERAKQKAGSTPEVRVVDW